MSWTLIISLQSHFLPFPVKLSRGEGSQDLALAGIRRPCVLPCVPPGKVPGGRHQFSDCRLVSNVNFSSLKLGWPWAHWLMCCIIFWFSWNHRAHWLTFNSLNPEIIMFMIVLTQLLELGEERDPKHQWKDGSFRVVIGLGRSPPSSSSNRKTDSEPWKLFDESHQSVTTDLSSQFSAFLLIMFNPYSDEQKHPEVRNPKTTASCWLKPWQALRARVIEVLAWIARWRLYQVVMFNIQCFTFLKDLFCCFQPLCESNAFFFVAWALRWKHLLRSFTGEASRWRV